MTDLSSTIIAKSDQTNADDLIVGPRVITITKVSAGSAEQPIRMNYEGDNGKPYMPCKMMRRALVYVWGADGSQYPGRSLQIYRDPSVKWGGIAVGGIRISHMSHMDKEVTLALAESKAVRKPYVIKPLTTSTKPDPLTWAASIESRIANLDPSITLEWWESAETKVPRRLLYAADKARHEALAEKVKAFVADVEGA